MKKGQKLSASLKWVKIRYFKGVLIYNGQLLDIGRALRGKMAENE